MTRSLSLFGLLLLVGCAHTAKTHPIVPLVPSGAPVDAVAAANGSRRVFEGRFVDDWLGIEIAIPDGFEPRIDFQDALLSIRNEDAMGAVLFVPSAFEPAGTDHFFAETLEAVTANVGELVADGEKHAVSLEWASGVERVWRNPGVTFRAAVGPLCSGRLTLAVITLERGPAGELSRERWSHAIAQLVRAPACGARYAAHE